MKQKLYKMIRKILSLAFYIKQNAKRRWQGYKYPSGTVATIPYENLKIGKNVSFGGRVALLGNGIINIGDNTMIGYGTIIHTSTHNYTKHPMWQSLISRPVNIGNHVWIGTGAIILPGVIIEDYSVIGAGAVVTANVLRGAIVAGNPARVIKYRELSNDSELTHANTKTTKIAMEFLQKNLK
jgi:acetyltransferase-like isoleucine patch superfamily enzyme